MSELMPDGWTPKITKAGPRSVAWEAEVEMALDHPGRWIRTEHVTSNAASVFGSSIRTGRLRAFRHNGPFEVYVTGNHCYFRIVEGD